MADTIFMIHGAWVGPWAWENFKGFFESQGYRCVTPTLRFHDMHPTADPDPRLGSTSLLDYAADLEREISGLPSMPILMGHSMGGLLAQILASRGIAKAIVLLASVPPAGVTVVSLSSIRFTMKLGVSPFLGDKPFRPPYAGAVYGFCHLMPPEEQEDIYSRLVFESGRAWREFGLWFLDSKRASRVDSSRVMCPVLAVAGIEDRAVPASVVRRTANKYRSVSTYKEFADHAHMVIAEPGWQEVAAYVGSWLNQTVHESA
jgi:pimeloyl-ACP methyl ester carboxylesterase